MSRCCTAVLVALCFCTTAFAQKSSQLQPPSYDFAQAPVDTSYFADIRELMDAMNARQSSRAVIASMREPLRTMMTGISEKVFNEFFDEFLTAADDGSLSEMTLPLYAQHFTKSDILELTAFYRSPIGKKLAREMPKIQTEASLVGQEWGKMLVQSFARKLQDKGYNPVKKM